VENCFTVSTRSANILCLRPNSVYRIPDIQFGAECIIGEGGGRGRTSGPLVTAHLHPNFATELSCLRMDAGDLHTSACFQRAFNSVGRAGFACNISHLRHSLQALGARVQGVSCDLRGRVLL
jgi:hypothetical protein